MLWLSDQLEPRIEQKACLSPDDRLGVDAWLARNLAREMHQSRIVASCYLDTLHLDNYYRTLEGLTPRAKVRVRGYGSRDMSDCLAPYRLEVKISGEHQRLKAVPKVVSPDEYQSLLRSGLPVAGLGMCVPMVLISYLRSYYHVHGLRLTLDTGLRYQALHPTFVVPEVADDWSVLELKAPIDFDLQAVANDFQFPRIKFSKYERAIEMLNPPTVC